MANYLDMMFSDPKLAQQMAAGPVDPVAFNSHLDTLAVVNSPSMAQSLGLGMTTPGVPAETAAMGATAPTAATAATAPAAGGAVNPAMLASLLSSSQKTAAQPHAPAATPAAGRGYTPLPAGTGTQRFTAPGFFKALYPR